MATKSQPSIFNRAEDLSGILGVLWNPPCPESVVAAAAAALAIDTECMILSNGMKRKSISNGSYESIDRNTS